MMWFERITLYQEDQILHFYQILNIAKIFGILKTIYFWNEVNSLAKYVINSIVLKLQPKEPI